MITWGFSSAFESIGGAEGFAGKVATGGNIHTTLLSDLTGTSGTNLQGSQTLTVGTISPSADSANPIAVVPSEYKLTLNITDSASGQAGSVVYTGRASEDTVWEGEPFSQVPVSRQVYVVGLEPDGGTTLTLGGNEYRVELTGRRGEDGNAYIDATVQVGEMHETPEPGTLVMAGIGLAGGIGAWLRRKRNSAAVPTAA